MKMKSEGIIRLHRIGAKKKLSSLINNTLQELNDLISTNLYELAQKEYTIKQLNALSASIYSKKSRRELIDFLAIHWQEIKGTYFSYTSIPDAPLTKICCAVADYLAECSKHSYPALFYLMPLVNYSLEENKYHYIIGTYDVSKLALADVIKFYITITSKRGEDWLIPIALFEHISLSMSEECIEKILVNPFTGESLSSMDIERMTCHSIVTEMLMRSFYQFHSLSKQSSSLYSAIEALSIALKKGEERSFFHRGVKGVAGAHTYLGLDAFRQYWNELSNEQKIMARRNSQLNRVLDDAILNPSWDDKNVPLLLESLIKMFSEDQDELVFIYLDQTQIEPLLGYWCNNFNQGKSILNDSMKQNIKYDGRDPLLLSPKQIIEVINEKQINSPRDVSFLLKDPNLENFAEVCKRFKKALVIAIGNRDGLMDVLTQLNPQQVTILIRVIGRVIKFNNHFFEFLNILEEEKMDAFLLGLGNRIWKIAEPDTLFVNLSTKKSRNLIYWKNIHRELVPLSISLEKIQAIVKFLPLSQGEIYLRNIQDILLQFSTHAVFCIQILSFLQEQSQSDYLKTLGGKLINLTENIYYFMIFLGAAKGSNKAYYLNQVECKLMDITTTPNELEMVLEILPKDKKTTYLNNMKKDKKEVFNEYMRLVCSRFIEEVQLLQEEQWSLLQKMEQVPSFDIDFFKEQISNLLLNQDKSYFHQIKEKAYYLFSTSSTFFKSQSENSQPEKSRSEKLKDYFQQVLDSNPEGFLAIRLFVFDTEISSNESIISFN